MYRILGVSRSPQFSPNCTARDAAIFDAVTSRLLRHSSVRIDTITEDFLFDFNPGDFDLVYTMARSETALRVLANGQERASLPIINSPQSLLRFKNRSLLNDVLEANAVPQPRISKVNPMNGADGLQETDIVAQADFPLWVKRADAPTQEKDDVRFIENYEQLYKALNDFAEKRCSEVQLVEHVEGDLIKFYGVEGADFFHYSYPTREGNFSKFGLEQHNGTSQEYDFSLNDLHTTATIAARASGFVVYGGDAVIRSDGTFVLIDFNDWPSFASVRKEAAKAIATRIYNELEHK